MFIIAYMIVVNFTWINWREENLASDFSFFDKDGSGYTSIDELQQAYEELGSSEFHLSEMIIEIDQDNVNPFFTVISIHIFHSDK
jgi:Ca2+-binding EF-hand superfamily protein